MNNKIDKNKENIGSKIFYEVEITNKAINLLIKEYKVKLEELTLEEFKLLLRNAEEDENIIFEGNGKWAWLPDEMEEICIINLEDAEPFCKVESLKIYVTRDLRNSEYYCYGYFGDVSQFFDYYIGCDDSWEDSKFKEQVFYENINNISWYYEENELKEAVDKELNKIKNDIAGEDLISFVGRGWTSLEEKIKELVDYNKDDYEVIGYYSGEEIYRIKNKLYYLTDDSGTCNNEYYWYLQELGPNGYNYFGVK